MCASFAILCFVIAVLKRAVDNTSVGDLGLVEQHLTNTSIFVLFVCSSVQAFGAHYLRSYEK